MYTVLTSQNRVLGARSPRIFFAAKASQRSCYSMHDVSVNEKEIQLIVVSQRDRQLLGSFYGSKVSLFITLAPRQIGVPMIYHSGKRDLYVAGLVCVNALRRLNMHAVSAIFRSNYT